ILSRNTPERARPTLVSFNGRNGAPARSRLVPAADGYFYGTTASGGIGFDGSRSWTGSGTVFKVTPGGTFTNLVLFNGTNGAGSLAALVQGADGNFYGTTYDGGAYRNQWGYTLGTIFRLTVSGA